MSGTTRRQALGVALAGVVAAALGQHSAFAGEDEEGLIRLLEAMEGFRTKIPPAQGLGETNGQSVPEIEPYLFQHLRGVAHRLGVKSRAEGMLLLTFLKDADAKIRVIAIYAIDKLVNAYPDGMSGNAMTDVKSDEHRRMVLRFVKRIDKLPA